MQRFARRPTVGSRLYRLGVALLALSLLPLASALQAGAAQEGYTRDEFSIVRKDHPQIRPRISGHYVVWQDYRNLPDTTPRESDVNADIYARDIETGDDIKVTDSHTAARPAISGKRIVYTDSRRRSSSGLDIRGYDLEADEVFIVTERGGDQDYPDIDGDLVVYQDHREGTWDIRGRDLKKGENFDVIVRDGDQVKPAISGKIVVWEDQRRGADEPDIFMKNLKTDEIRRITDNGNSRDPDISGNWVVFRTGDPDSDDQRIRVYSIKDDEIRWSSDRMRIGSGPRIDGNLVVWSDKRNDEDYNIWAYDIANDREFKVSTAEDDQLAPDVDGTTVVWQDERGDRSWDIRGARLTLPEPTPTPTPTPSAGASSRDGAGDSGPADSGPCYFTLGFKLLRDQIPSIVGDCLENEWHNPDNGDGLQRTTGGLLVWRKADNWTAFTNGSMTWLNGPCGLQTRPNQGPFFPWEGRIGGSCS